MLPLVSQTSGASAGPAGPGDAGGIGKYGTFAARSTLCAAIACMIQGSLQPA